MKMFKFKKKSNFKFKFYDNVVAFKNQSDDTVKITTGQFSAVLPPDKKYHKFSINAFKSQSNNVDLSHRDERHSFKLQVKTS